MRNSISEIYIKFKDWASNYLFQRIFVVINKTYKDIYSLKKLLIALAILLTVPVIFILLPTSVDFGLISPYHAASINAIALIFPFFFWTIGIAFTITLGSSGAPLIAEELKSGTMLILISGPISRVKIFLGKYIALFLFGILISLVSIFTIGWISVLIKSGNIDHFISLIPFLAAMFLYSLFLVFLFTSITLAFSSLVKKSRSATMIVVAVVIFTFVGFLVIRMMVGDFYVTFQLYHFDLGYHLGNVFVFFIESLNAVPPSVSWQLFFGMLTGVYSTQSAIDPDQGLNLGGLETTNYYLPVFSFLIWMIIAVLLLIFGALKLKKRDITL